MHQARVGQRYGGPGPGGLGHPAGQQDQAVPGGGEGAQGVQVGAFVAQGRSGPYGGGQRHRAGRVDPAGVGEVVQPERGPAGERVPGREQYGELLLADAGHGERGHVGQPQRVAGRGEAVDQA